MELEIWVSSLGPSNVYIECDLYNNICTLYFSSYFIFIRLSG